MPTPEDHQPQFDDITTRLRNERQQLSSLELDGLKGKVMAQAHRRGGRLLRWTGSARWIAIGTSLAVVAAATGGTIATVNGNGGGGISGVAQNAACAQYAQKINFRMHYSANGSSGSWSATTGTTGCNGTVSIGPQGMEGNLQVQPGTTVKLGYDFTDPGNNTTFSLTVTPTWTLYYTCAKGSPSPASSTVSLPPMTYTFSDSQWYPTGDQSNAAAYETSLVVPAVCGANTTVSLSKGVLFTANVNAS